MKFYLVSMAIAWALLEGCKTTLPPEPDYVVYPPEDAGDPLCRLACENMARIPCPESAPAGKTCRQVCEDAERGGNPLNLVCLANASTREQVRACGTVRCAEK